MRPSQAFPLRLYGRSTQAMAVVGWIVLLSGPLSGCGADESGNPGAAGESAPETTKAAAAAQPAADAPTAVPRKIIYDADRPGCR